ncbi:MAG TPA: protein kinase [Streptosporangiaceae bacterium]|nr:protein kinase [Streptosporangiaceae bacterium]
MVRALEPGDPVVIGPYRLRGQLGAGGMGRVFLGLSAGGRLAAVKVIRAELAMDPEFRARFEREVAVARKVSHQFTAPVIDADLDGPVPWLATAYVAGPSLADAVAEHGPMPARTVLNLAAGLAEGLAAIHAAGVVHRDLKPSNVLLASDGPRVIDFGISLGAEGSALTRTGLVMGSPGFMSPEQAEGREVGPASDIFSLGAILTFAATGEGPFGAGSNMTLVHRLVSGQAHLDRVPPAVRRLAERCLAADPRQRPNASDLLAETRVAEPAAGWLPDRMTRAFVPYQAQAATSTAPAYVPTVVSRTPKTMGYTPTMPSQVPTQAFSAQTMVSANMDPRPGQPQARTNRGRPGRLGRRLAIALVVAGVSGGLGAGGIALAASPHQSPGAHSAMGVPMQMTSPSASAPHASAPTAMDPSTEVPPAPAAMPTSMTPAPAPSMPVQMSPAATPPATATPATPTATASATPAATPATAPPTATTAPAPAPTGAAAPTPVAS